MSSSGYDYTLHGRCVAVLLAAGKRAPRLEEFFSRLAATPFTCGNYRETDAQGRALQVVLHDEWLVTFWADHAAKQLHIVDLDEVGRA